MLPAIDHAFLLHARRVDTFRVLEHKKSKRISFKEEMERVRHQGQDRPGLPPPKALASSNLEPLKGGTRCSLTPLMVRGLDLPASKPASLAPVTPLAAQMKVKLLKDNKPSKLQALPLAPITVSFSLLLRYCTRRLHAFHCRCQGGAGGRQQYFKELNKSRSIMKDSFESASIQVHVEIPGVKRLSKESIAAL